MCVPICSKYITVHNRHPPKFVKNCRVFFVKGKFVKYFKRILHFSFSRILSCTNCHFNEFSRIRWGGYVWLSDCWQSIAVAAYFYIPVLFAFFYFLLPTTKIIFSEKNIEELFFFSLSKTKIIFFRAKTFLFVFSILEKKKKRKQFRFISKKEIIIFNYLRIFEEEVYYALNCPLKSYLALELSIWRRWSHQDVWLVPRSIC